MKNAELIDFKNEVLKKSGSSWASVVEPLGRAEWFQANLGAVIRGEETVPSESCVYMLCADRLQANKIFMRILINGTAWVRNTFGEAGVFVDSHYFRGEGGKRQTYKSEMSLGAKRWMDSSKELYQALSEGGYRGAYSECGQAIASGLAPHETNLIKIGQAVSLISRMGGYRNPKYPMTKSLLDSGLMDHIELVGFMGVDLSLEETMIREYSRRYGSPPIWEQRVVNN